MPESREATLELRQSEVPSRNGRRPIVRPALPPGRVARDAEQALGELEAARWKAFPDDARRPPRRPDLGYDVTSGIQQQGIQRTLRP